MILRILNLLVIVGLIVAATYVYDIKFESTLQAERVGKLRAEIRRERDAVAALRAEWARLDTPSRLQDLAQRHLKLQTMNPRQVDNFAQLPERPKPPLFQGVADPIGALIETPEQDLPTGSTGKRDAP